jgi:hypothetical protein
MTLSSLEFGLTHFGMPVKYFYTPKLFSKMSKNQNKFSEYLTIKIIRLSFDWHYPKMFGLSVLEI